MISLDHSTQTVVKTPHGVENESEIAVERRIYERLQERGGHPAILKYHDLLNAVFASSLRLVVIFGPISNLHSPATTNKNFAGVNRSPLRSNSYIPFTLSMVI